MAQPKMRAAVPQHAAKVETLVQDAYGKYVERLGKPPAPMTTGYRRLVDAGSVRVLDLEGTVLP